MRKIKNWKLFLENYKTEELLNSILDKINDKGLDSLTKREKEILDNWDNPNYEIPKDPNEITYEKTVILNWIKDWLKEHGETTAKDLDLDSSIFYKDTDSEIHLIEEFENEEVTVNVYSIPEYTKKHDYKIPYTELELETLTEIQTMLDWGAQFLD